MRTALFSAFDKTGVVEAAKRLHGTGDWQILASGGTARAIAAAGIPVCDIATLVGEPLLGHRVVTLSREIHAGLLAQDNPADRAELSSKGIPFIDLVYVNLYPLADEVKRPEATLESVLGRTDIGGPCMLRSAAKGRRIVVFASDDLEQVIKWLVEEHGGKDDLDYESIIATLCWAAEDHVASYVRMSARWLGDHDHQPKRQAAIEAHAAKGGTSS